MGTDQLSTFGMSQGVMRPSMRRRRPVSASTEPRTPAALIVPRFAEGNSCCPRRDQSFSFLTCDPRVSRARIGSCSRRLLRVRAILYGCLLSTATVTGFGTYGTARVRPPLRSGRRFWFDESARGFDAEVQGSRWEDGACFLKAGCLKGGTRKAGCVRQRDMWSQCEPVESLVQHGTLRSKSACRMSTVMKPPPRSLENRHAPSASVSSSSLPQLERSVMLSNPLPMESSNESNISRARRATVVRRIPFLTDDR